MYSKVSIMRPLRSYNRDFRVVILLQLYLRDRKKLIKDVMSDLSKQYIIEFPFFQSKKTVALIFCFVDKILTTFNETIVRNCPTA